MAQHLFLTSKLDVPRRQRFPDRFVDDITALVCAISADIGSRYHKVDATEGIYSNELRKVFLNLFVYDLSALFFLHLGCGVGGEVK